MIFKVAKKYRYIIYSFLTVGLLAWFSYALNRGEHSGKILLLLFLVSINGLFFVHYPNVTLKSSFFLVLLPMHALLGALFSFIYFPNLSLLFKFLVLLAVGGGLYLINLVNNIFVVVAEKEEPIPLFRVAVVWCQILIVTIAIPFLAGIFKSPFNFFVQNLLSSFSTFLLSFYLLWAVSFDKEIKAISWIERITVSFLLAFYIFCMGVSVSFIPTEPFLRALFISACLMTGIGYLYAHYKNKISEKLLLEYSLTLFISLSLVLIFNS